MPVVQDDHDALAVRQLLHEVPNPGVAGGLHRSEALQDPIEHPPTTVDPVAASHADSLEPPLDGGRVPKLTERLTTQDIGVLDGVFGGLRTQERPSECQEAGPEAFEGDVVSLAVQPGWIRQGAMDGGEPRRIGRHGAGAIR
jgi:hypothetical protein